VGSAGHVARLGEMNNAYKILIGKPEWYGPVGRASCTWQNNINLNISEIWCDYADIFIWIWLQVLVNTYNEFYITIMCGSSLLVV
jgi:hypothetical protein